MLGIGQRLLRREIFAVILVSIKPVLLLALLRTIHEQLASAASHQSGSVTWLLPAKDITVHTFIYIVDFSGQWQCLGHLDHKVNQIMF